MREQRQIGYVCHEVIHRQRHWKQVIDHSVDYEEKQLQHQINNSIIGIREETCCSKVSWKLVSPQIKVMAVMDMSSLE